MVCFPFHEWRITQEVITVIYKHVYIHTLIKLKNTKTFILQRQAIYTQQLCCSLMSNFAQLEGKIKRIETTSY